MDIQGFNVAKAQFPLQYEENFFSPIEEKRRDFVAYFNREKIANMTLDEYVMGKQIKNHNFCYGLEIALQMLGRINGAASSQKFGVYYKKDEGVYYNTNKFGDNYHDAFNEVKKSILDLLDAGEKEDFNGIILNRLAPIVKGKILSVYFPETYLNIFSFDHLNYYLKAFDLATDSLLKANELYKKKVLLEFKNNDPTMKSWSVNMFAVFLWKYFPKAPENEPAKRTKTAAYHLNKDERSIRHGKFGFEGEGKQHLQLKEFIYNNPEFIGIRDYVQKDMEHILLSGDRLDVWFKLADGSEIAIEVKSKISSDADILRGLYQCVKYKSILDAENLAHNECHNNRTYLVLGGALSASNKEIQKVFDIATFENVMPI